MKSRTAKQKPRNHRAVTELDAKWVPAFLKYAIPPKLRRRDPWVVWLLHNFAEDLAKVWPHFLKFRFLEDPVSCRCRLVLDCPNRRRPLCIDVPGLLPVVWKELERDPGKVLRIIADFLDALKASKGDRGARFIATQKLFVYARLAAGNAAKKLHWKELKDQFCTYYEDDKNWQKFLRERGIPFEKGRFKGAERVRNRGRNTLRGNLRV